MTDSGRTDDGLRTAIGRKVKRRSRGIMRSSYPQAEGGGRLHTPCILRCGQKTTKRLQLDENKYKILTSNDAICNTLSYMVFYLILSISYHEDETFGFGGKADGPRQC